MKGKKNYLIYCINKTTNYIVSWLFTKKKHHARHVCQSVLYNGESRNSNYDDLLWVHGPRVGNWSWQRGGTSSKNRLESPLIHILIHKYIHILTHTYIHSHIYTCIYIHIHIYLYIYTYIYSYIYTYIFTYLISTSIHGTREKQKKTLPGTRDKSISNHRPGEKEKNYWSKRKKRPTWSDPLKKKSRDTQSVVKRKLKTFRESCNATITKVLNTSGANYKINLNRDWS